MDLEEHAEDLASDLGVDKAEVEADLENLISYSVPMDEAKQSLRRKYGDGSSGETEIADRNVADIAPGDSNVAVTAVVLTAGTRSIRYQGEDHIIHEGTLADETGTISYTAWEDFDLTVGETVRIENAGVREWEGNPELNLGERTMVEPADEPLSVPYEPGGEADLVDLEIGDRGVTVEVRVVELEEKVIDGRDGETEILSGVLADETARLPFTDWDPHSAIETGASVRLENVFIREFRGVPSINVSEYSTVDVLEEPVSASDAAPRFPVGEAVETGGLFDVELVGNVISVRDGSGLIERCPDCSRIVQNGQCRSHGQVEGEDDLRVKAILDDGTGTVTAVLGTELTEAIYGGDVDDAKEQARDEMDRDVVAERIRGRLVGREYRVRGSLSVDDFGANLEATEFEEVTEDATDRARSLLEGVSS